MALKHNPAKSGQAFSIQIDGSSRPVALIGRVNVVVTTGRGVPPVPYSGFVTEHTPFDRGHIMALELGGPDIRENIVPQYRQWQQTGTWRRFEDNLGQKPKANGAIFVAKLVYPTMCAETYDAQQKRFQKNEIFDWKDLCIPDSFTVWFLPAGDALAQKIEKDLLTVGAVEKTFTDLLLEIEKIAAYGTLKHDCMPPEDVTFWKNQQIGFAVDGAYQAYLKQREDDIAEMATELTTNPVPGLTTSQQKDAVDVTRSPKRTNIEFAMTQKPLIEAELQKTWGWSPTETVALDGGRVIKAYTHDYKKKQQKLDQKRHDDYVKEASASNIKWKGFVARGVPDKGKGYKSNKPY